MEQIALYKVVQNCIGFNESGSIEFRKDDILEILVQSLFSEDKNKKPGWLYAYNRKRNQSGFIPVEFVKLLGSEVNKTIHHPSALGVEVSFKLIDSGGCNTINHPTSLGVEVLFPTCTGIKDTDGRIKLVHNFQRVYVLRPILCNFCRDYIWGRGKICNECKEVELRCMDHFFRMLVKFLCLPKLTSIFNF